MDEIHKHEVDLTRYGIEKLSEIKDLRIIGPRELDMRGGTLSFTVGEIHPHDLGQYLDSQGIAVRTGHHCAWPLMRKLNLVGTTRASLYLYNSKSDVDSLLESIEKVKSYFKVSK
jgi:cysteine desulfurase/selenocysteine lyase